MQLYIWTVGRLAQYKVGAKRHLFGKMNVEAMQPLSTVVCRDRSPTYITRQETPASLWMEQRPTYVQ